MNASDLLAALIVAVIAPAIIACLVAAGRWSVSRIPMAALSLISKVLPRELREDLYAEEWRPELIAILQRSDKRAARNFYDGLRYAIPLAGYSFRTSLATFRLARISKKSPQIVRALSPNVLELSDGTFLLIGKNVTGEIDFPGGVDEKRRVILVPRESLIQAGFAMKSSQRTQRS